MKRLDLRALRLTVGLSVVLACLLFASLPALVWYLKGWGVAAAVRASFPEVCNEWRDKLVARPSPAGWFTQYDVICVYGYTTDQMTVMTVNVLTCEARPALTWPRNWQHLQKMVLSGGQKMPICP